ncbi:MAG TPA: tetratricopeptide repeat protein [Bryobacteraceae bacterium]|jgi:tetratricopeptide (TPR) repeat protein|nr:tetratricopeptide repeat protein [Bryobacteraceae bacterium]
MKSAIPVIVLLCGLGSPGWSADSSEARRWLLQAQSAFERGDWAAAETSAKRALQIEPKTADAYVLLGLTASRENKIAEAEQLFRKASRLEPGNYRTLSYIGSTCLQQGRAGEAAVLFTRVLQIQPGNPVAHYNLGLIDLAKGNAAGAKRHFDAVTAAAPGDIPARIGALESNLILKNHAAARTTARELDALLPPESPDRMRAAALLGGYGEYQDAVPILRKIPSNSPDAASAQFDLALALFRLKAYDQAATALAPALAKPAHADALSLLGDIEDARNHGAEALSAYRQATEVEPAKEDFWFNYGFFLLRQNHANEAAKVFADATLRLPHSARLRLGHGAALYLAGNYEAAANLLLMLPSTASHPTLCYYLLGEMYDAAPDLRDRIAAAFDAYLASGPADAMAYREQGKILFLRGQPGPAKASLKRSLELDPTLAESYLQLAIIEQSENNDAGSVRLLEKALALKPALSTAHYRLALAYRRLDLQDKAAAEMDRYRARKAEEESIPKQELLRSLQ